MCISRSSDQSQLLIITISACSPPTEFRAQQEGLFASRGPSQPFSANVQAYFHLPREIWLADWRILSDHYLLVSFAYPCCSVRVFPVWVITMIFEPAERVLLPTKDLLSYIFDDPPYDQDKPVSLNNGMFYYAKQGWFIYYLDLYRYS